MSVPVPRASPVPPSAESIGGGRRVLDVTVSLTALALLLPVLVAVAVVVRCTSRGPVLFRQERVGTGGRPFTMVKFRTMTGSDGPEVTSATDARVTPFGRLLRETSMDELPQLVNVLRGQMTLVGPRPETLALAARYPADCRWVLQHTPGLTGPCQIRLRDRDVLPDGISDVEAYYLAVLVRRRVDVDATYLRAPSVGATLRVMLETLAYLVGKNP